MKAVKENWPAFKEDMTGWHIWCFTCNAVAHSKKLLRQYHLNHEVDWVRDTDGLRYAFLPDNSLPRVDHAPR